MTSIYDRIINKGKVKDKIKVKEKVKLEPSIPKDEPLTIDQEIKLLKKKQKELKDKQKQIEIEKQREEEIRIFNEQVKLKDEEDLKNKVYPPLPTIPDEDKVPKMPNHVEEYFAKEASKEAFSSRELFNANKDNVELKTDLKWEELVLVNKLIYNNQFLIDSGLEPVYNLFLDKYMRLKFSMDRKSRGEFVQVNKANTNDEALGIASNIANIAGVKR